MVKQASAEQVKALAGMIKSAQVDKKAKLPGAGYLKGFFTGMRSFVDPVMPTAKVTVRQSVSLPALWEHMKKHPRIYGGIGGGAGLLGSGYLLGNAGNSELKDALNRSNTQLQKTTDALNKAKKGTGSFWGDLSNTFKWLLERFGKLFSSSSTETPKVSAATKQ